MCRQSASLLSANASRVVMRINGVSLLIKGKRKGKTNATAPARRDESPPQGLPLRKGGVSFLPAHWPGASLTGRDWLQGEMEVIHQGSPYMAISAF